MSDTYAVTESTVTEWAVRYATGQIRSEGTGGEVSRQAAEREVARIAHNAQRDAAYIDRYGPGLGIGHDLKAHPAEIISRQVTTRVVTTPWERVADECIAPRGR